MPSKKIHARIFNHLASLLDPRLCPSCQHALPQALSFCDSCKKRLLRISSPCRLCGQENRGRDDVCAICLHRPPQWQGMLTPLEYQGLTRDLLMQLKFSQSLHLANTLVHAVIEYFVTQADKPEILLPVPLDRHRYRERGYNQAAEITGTLSALLGIRADYRSLQRIRHTSPQSGLSAAQRKKNVLKAFSYHNPVACKHVAVVDDIITTGSTVNEITQVLRQAGIEKVEVWGLARVSK